MRVLILAYSRCLFIQYYPRFTRFEAKQFLLEAVRFLAGCCPTCVIDNTSVIVVAGAGDEAVFAPEMVAFARTLGFAFRAHPVNQPDRKGRVERPFAWVEGNFLAGRTFADFADLNSRRGPGARGGECQAEARPRDGAERGLRGREALPAAAAGGVAAGLSGGRAGGRSVRLRVHRDQSLLGARTLGGQDADGLSVSSELRICAREQLVAVHPRLIGVRDAKQKLPGHHPTPQRRDRTPPPEATLLQGHHPVLDAYVAALVKQAHGRGVRPLRRLLEFRRTIRKHPSWRRWRRRCSLVSSTSAAWRR
jgi:hypothetical protein